MSLVPGAVFHLGLLFAGSGDFMSLTNAVFLLLLPVFQFIPKDVEQEGSEHCWPPSIRKTSGAFPILHLFLF